MTRSRLRRARDEAHRLLVDLGMRRPEHIEPIETAKDLGVEVTFGNLDLALARVYRLGSRARIRLSDRITHPGRQRFSIAHELGHIVLDHDVPGASDTSRFLARACGQQRFEKEANAFAFEHLMPESMVRPYCDVKPVSLDRVRAIAETFRVSLVASSMRFVELTSERCALVYSERNKVKWTRRSTSFPAPIPRRTLRSDSVAFGCFYGGPNDDAPRVVPASAWLDGGAQGAEASLVEHVVEIAERGWGGILSLLWMPEVATHPIHPPIRTAS